MDYALAETQSEGYVAALEDTGWPRLELPPLPDFPDAVFVEDALVLHDGLAIVTRSGASARRGESASARSGAEEAGYTVVEIIAPATLDGGDVLRCGRTAFVGSGSRTNAAGVAQLAAHLEPSGAQIVCVPLGPVLHLKTAVGRLPDGSLVGYTPFLRDPLLLGKLRAVPEPSGAQVLCLDTETVMLASDCPRSAALYERLGLRTVVVEIGEFQKLEAAVTCLSVLSAGP